MKAEEDDKQAQILHCWQAAIAAVNGRSAVNAALQKAALDQNNAYDYLIAIGKAASQMTLGAYDIFPSIKQALVITKRGHVDQALEHRKGLDIIESGHPIPDQQSLDAGARLLAFINKIPHEGKIILLISGGASSLVEVLPEGINLAQLQALNEQCMASGFAIDEINTRRASLSLIKGGQLAHFLEGRETLALYISDVVGDRLDVIGSGLVFHSKEQAANAIHHQIIANNKMACEAAMKAAQKLGLSVFFDEYLYHQDISIVADKIAIQLKHGKKGLYIWGGESTISLPANPGKGGRNQALALCLAQKIAGLKDVSILVAGTDGNDGPTNAAGAWVDGSALEAGQQMGLNVKDFEQQANAYRFFDPLDKLFKPGPSGTNVMDMVIALVN